MASSFDVPKRLHAAQHGAGGSDPITPADIGAMGEAEMEAAAQAAAAPAVAAAADAATRAENAEAAKLEIPDANVSALLGNDLTETYAAAADVARESVAGTVAHTHLWHPPTQPAGPDLTTRDAAEILYDWDQLVTAAPGYVTRESIGNGTDGLPIYAYTFAPPTWGSTIFLTAEHGGEKISMYAALQLLTAVINNHRDDANLAALRSRTRIVVVPVVSRTAVDANARKNANGVDLNRNWDYKWATYPSAPADVTYKGTAPFSEPETIALRDKILALEAEGDLVAALDLHDTGANPKPSGYHFFANLPDRVLSGDGSWVRSLTDDIALDQGVTTPNRALTVSDQPQMQNWCAARGIRSATIEYESRWGSGAMDSDNQTAALRFVGNAILRAARMPATRLANPQPFARRFTFTSDTSTIPIPQGSGIGAELAELRYEFTPPCAGIVEFYGTLTVSGPTASQVTIIPTVGQSGTLNSQTNPSSTYDSVFGNHIAGSGDAAITLPFNVSRGVIEDPAFPVRATIYAYSRDAVSYLYRYRGVLVFTPSNGGDRMALMTATGRGGQGAGAMQVVQAF